MIQVIKKALISGKVLEEPLFRTKTTEGQVITFKERELESFYEELQDLRRNVYGELTYEEMEEKIYGLEQRVGELEEELEWHKEGGVRPDC